MINFLVIFLFYEKATPDGIRLIIWDMIWHYVVSTHLVHGAKTKIGYELIQTIRIGKFFRIISVMTMTLNAKQTVTCVPMMARH